jgi:hypothetical protein
MSPDTLTPADSVLRPAPGRENPLPEWVSTTDRNALPNVLDWASESPRPPINGRVDVVRFGISLGTGTAVGYFHRAGELGILVELDSVPPILDLPAGTKRAHFFGENITRLDQGDEPDEAPETAGVQDIPVYKADVDPQATESAASAADTQESVGEGADSDEDYLEEDEKISL